MSEKKTNQPIITITMQQASIGVSLIILFLFFTFTGGYFLGQKKAIQEFAYRLEQDSLGDHIYSSLCSLYDLKDENDDSEPFSESEPDIGQLSENTNSSSQEPATIASPEEAQGSKKQYLARIAGYPHGLLEQGKAAQALLTKKGFSVELVERLSESKTKKAKKTYVWHQLITKPYDSYQALVADRTLIAKIAHVKENDILIEEVE